MEYALAKPEAMNSKGAHLPCGRPGHDVGRDLNLDANPPSDDVVRSIQITSSTAPAAQQKRRKKKKKKEKSPQQALADFWASFQTRKPGKITSVFPRRLYKQLLPVSAVLGPHEGAPIEGSRSGANTPPTTPASNASLSWSTISASAAAAGAAPSSSPPLSLGASASNAAASYETAAQACRAAVARIVRECRRTNEKFTDPDFNLEDDPRRNCLRGLVRRRAVDEGHQPMHTPESVHRVDWIFEKPVFVAAATATASADGDGDGGSSDLLDFAASDVRQGRVGDCWWIAAVATIAHRTDLMRRVCVARDEACGVYGFVFQRDGAWCPVVVDDNLYLKNGDFAESKYDSTGQRAREHRERHQRGSEALSFARCEDANETWLPLLEKVFAKAHGDYGALAGGWCSEGVEDLTGGVTTTVAANRVLDKDRLWAELASGGEGGRRFVFGLSVLGCDCMVANHNGLALNHCYSVLQAVEAEDEEGKAKVRLVKIRNPWGERNEWTGIGEWHGRWSDGSKEWNAYWIAKLGHTFGDDGVFWMAYEDVLATFGWLHRTRLFDAQWTVVQQWTSVDVAWVAGYLQTRFVVDVKKPGTMVVVLSQLDDRYYRGLKGQYTFTLHFVLRQAATDASTDAEILSIVHAPNAHEARSISCEVELAAAGRYEVLPQVTGRRDRQRPAIDEVVRETTETNPQKLRQVGRQYDAAHAKGAGVTDEDLALETRREKQIRRAREKKAWQKAQRKRAREQKFREELAEWKENREKAKEAKKAKEKTRKQKNEKKEEEDGNADDKDGDSKKGGKKEDAMKDEKNEKETTDEETSSESSADDTESDADADADADPGPEPRPVPEPDFDLDTNSEDNEFDLLDESSDDDDDKQAEQKKKVEKKGRPFDSDDDSDCDLFHGHFHGHVHKDKKANDEASPWNAVCVLGLRVYSQDPETTITLVKPEGKTTGKSETVKCETKEAKATKETKQTDEQEHAGQKKEDS